MVIERVTRGIGDLQLAQKNVGEDQIKRMMETNPALLEAFRAGRTQDVHEILAAYNIAPVDYKDWLQNRGAELNRLIKPADDSFIAVPMSTPPPNLEMDFAQHDSSAKLTSDDRFTFKAMNVGKAEGAGDKLNLAPDKNFVNDTLNVAEERADFLTQEAVNIQFQMQLNSKGAELQRDLDEIVAKIRSGAIEDPLVLVFALTKVNMEYNGLMVVQNGKKFMNLNDEMNKYYGQLKTDSSIQTMYGAQAGIKNVGNAMQFLMQNLQKGVQNIETTLQTANSLTGMIGSGRMEMIRRQPTS